nr:AAA family ATPase [Actinomycetota bacterium]
MTVASGHLVGREDELQAVLGLLETPGLLPGTVALAGEAGIGKTTVWLAALASAQELDYRVLSSRPAEAETGFSFAGLTDLLGDAVGEALPELPAPQRRALEAALLLADADEQGADERSVALAFLNTLRALARARPLVVGVDDVQWLDPPSSAVVRFALTRLRDEPVAALFACRGVVPEWLRRASSERLLEVDVGPLSVGALYELFRTRLDRIFARPTLLRLWETSGGNPFFALELARALERRGGRVEPGEELPIPRTLAELLAERLDALTPQAADVARVVAALAEPTLDLVRAAAGTSASTGVSDGVAARVLDVDGDRIRFSHPLLASAVSARTPPDARRAVH